MKCYKAPKQKKNRLSKQEYKNYTFWLGDNFPVCQMCNIFPTIEFHHLEYGSYGADKNDRSLIAVCRNCHEYAHKNKHESQELYADVAQSNWSSYENK